MGWIAAALLKPSSGKVIISKRCVFCNTQLGTTWKDYTLTSSKVKKKIHVCPKCAKILDEVLEIQGEP